MPTTLTTQDAPLGDLDVSQYTYSSFIYPIDLAAVGTGTDHYMVFHINETTTTQFNSIQVNGKAPTQQPTIIQNQMNNSSGTSTQGQNGNSASNGVFDVLATPIRRIATTIVLYMPNEITCNYSADWEAVELGLAKEVVDVGSGQGSWADVFKSAGVSGLQNIGNLANEFTGLSLKDALSSKTRLAVNNHLEVIFKGVGFRKFQFQFRFTPQSEAEAINVDNIIRAFKFYASPEIISSAGSSRFMIYPAEFDLEYYANGKINKFLHLISTCALTDISINYTGAGKWAAHRPHSQVQGAMSVCTDLTLSFMELEIMQKRLIQKGY